MGGSSHLIQLTPQFNRLNSPVPAWIQPEASVQPWSWAHGQINGWEFDELSHLIATIKTPFNSIRCTGSAPSLAASSPESCTGSFSKFGKVTMKPILMISKKAFSHLGAFLSFYGKILLELLKLFPNFSHEYKQTHAHTSPSSCSDSEILCFSSKIILFEDSHTHFKL